jgi:FdhD protein
MTDDLPDNGRPAAGDPPPEQPQPTRRCAVRRYADGHFTALDDQVVAEARVELVVNDDELRMALLCLPRQLTELAVGFLRGEGALRSRGEIDRIDIDQAGRTVRVRGRFDPDALDAIRRRWTWGTGCGGGGTSAQLNPEAYQPAALGLTVNADALVGLVHTFLSTMELWKSTGGVHACALAGAAELLIVAEDIGRHNAFDKVIGRAVLDALDTSDKIVLTTGRLSAEMVSKAVAARVPIVVGRGAVTDLAIELARKFGLTLVGFARAGRFNVYTGFQRVVAGSR